MRSGSVAYKDGQLQKGDRIISINGKTMTGLTHAESVAILKVVNKKKFNSLNLTCKCLRNKCQKLQ